MARVLVGNIKGAPGDAGVSPTIDAVKVNGVTTLTIKDAEGTEEVQIADGANGKDGADGAPGAEGKDGADGPAGADGKSAYAYAQDGGYAGTEEEFAEKLAEEAPKAFYVTVTVDETSGYTADKTLDEIKAAYDAGRAVYCLAEVDGFQMIHGLVTFIEEEGYSAAFFTSPVLSGIITSVIIDTETVAVSTEEISQMESLVIRIGNSTVTYNGTAGKLLNVQSLKNPNALTINGTTYDGSEAVDFTDTINAMINTKLSAIGVAEEGAY